MIGSFVLHQYHALLEVIVLLDAVEHLVVLLISPGLECFSIKISPFEAQSMLTILADVKEMPTRDLLSMVIAPPVPRNRSVMFLQALVVAVCASSPKYSIRLMMS